MINKKLSEINLTDIQALIDNSVSEGKNIEFKELYNLNSDKEKGEFLADISSFANTDGGNLIFGIKEEGGIAQKLTPFKIEDIDAEKLKIENIVRDSISPRMIIEMKFIEIQSGEYILIFKIPKSRNSPHRVIFNPYSKTKDQFYGRSSAGKYPLDVNDLKNAFTLSETLTEKVKSFRTKRITDIIGEDTPVPLLEGGKIILHAIPIEAFSSNNIIDIAQIKEKGEKLKPIFAKHKTSKININGVNIYSATSEDKAASEYTQLYRTGIIELVDAKYLSKELRSEEKKYYADWIEGRLMSKLKEFLDYFNELQIGMPVIVSLSICGSKGFIISSEMFSHWSDPRPINTDIILCPEHLIQTYSESSEEVLRPMFDIIRNAGGCERSLNFDENGNWLRPAY